MRLNNKRELLETKGAWLSKYNVIYFAIFIIMMIIPIASGGDMVSGIFLAGILCVGMLFVKQEIAKYASYGIRNFQFDLSCDITAEEIIKKTYQSFLEENIEINFEKNVLSFKGKYAVYDYIWNKDNQSFSLYWHFSWKKAFLSFQYIRDYKNLLEETGMIAFIIQQ